MHHAPEDPTGSAILWRCVRRGAASTSLDLVDENRPAATTEEIINICAQIGAPEIGMPRVQWAEEIIRAQTFCIELLAGTVCERIIFPHLTPLAALHDQLEARAFASVACASRDSIDAMLTYAEAEAEGIIRGQLGVVSALIDALVDKGTLMGDEVDLIIRDTIARNLMAAEHDHRKQWQRVLANAATIQITRAMFASDLGLRELYVFSFANSSE